MALKSKIERIEKKINPQLPTHEEFVVITGKTEGEFEGKRNEYLKANPEPKLFIQIRRFCGD